MRTPVKDCSQKHGETCLFIEDGTMQATESAILLHAKPLFISYLIWFAARAIMSGDPGFFLTS